MWRGQQLRKICRFFILRDWIQLFLGAPQTETCNEMCIIRSVVNSISLEIGNDHSYDYVKCSLALRGDHHLSCCCLIKDILLMLDNRESEREPFFA